jgi:uncharacterized protein (DUF1697 family)
MPVAICMLRGVNLGGNKKIKMEALRALCTSLGCEDVKTFINSGNVVFRTKQRSPERLGKGIEDAIEEEAGFRAGVVLRSTAEMRKVLVNNPFAKRKGIEPGKLLVNFLADAPSSDTAKKLEALDTAPDELYVRGREMYIYFPNGQGQSKLKWSPIDKLLNMTFTGRNWNTTTKLLEMAEALEKA